jgi:hypothetical protein
MLIRVAVLSFIAACTGNPPPPEIIELGQPETGACQPANYPCTPGNPWSETVCDVICGGEGFDGRGYCAPYSSMEDAWCAGHPGMLFHGDPRRPCDPLGNPTWQTRCKPGWSP